MEWSIEGKQLKPSERRFIVERDNFTCQKCGVVAEIKTLDEYHWRWIRERSKSMGINAFYFVRDSVLSEGVSKVIREEILGDKFDCNVIFEFINSAGFEVDHITPVRDGGTNLPSNLQTLCRACHKRKCVDDRKIREYIRFERSPVGVLI